MAEAFLIIVNAVSALGRPLASPGTRDHALWGDHGFALDTVSLGILFGALLVLAGILSSLVALRFGAPLLLVFLVVGMLAGEEGPGGIRFDDVRTAYIVGSVALALILFDGGLRTRLSTFRSVLAPSFTLATAGVVLTAALTAPIARYALGLGWPQSLLVGSVVASTDAAAVFAPHPRPRPAAAAARRRHALEIEVRAPTTRSRSSSPCCWSRSCCTGPQSWSTIAAGLAEKAFGGALIGILGGRGIVLVLNRLALPQGLHAPFVTTGALVVFGLAETLHSSGFLAVYVAMGLVVGNRLDAAPTTPWWSFLDAATWLAQIGMFLILGLLATPQRLPDHALAGLAIALALDAGGAAARGASSACCRSASSRREERVHPRGSACAARSASSSPPSRRWSVCRLAQLYFDVGFVVVLVSLLGAGTGPSRRRRTGCTSRCRAPIRRRAASSSTCRASSPRSWSATRSTPTIPICAAASCRPGPSSCWWCATSRCSPRPKRPTSAKATMSISWHRPSGPRRSTASSSTRRRRRRPGPAPARRFLRRRRRDALGALAEIYGLTVPPEDAPMATLSDYMVDELGHPGAHQRRACGSAPSRWWRRRRSTAAPSTSACSSTRARSGDAGDAHGGACRMRDLIRYARLAQARHPSHPQSGCAARGQQFS